MARKSYLEAIRDAQFEEMKRDPNVFIMGEDLTSNLFGATTGFVEAFGAERVRNTPISEAGFVGAAAGAAMVGMRPIVDVTIASFIYPAMDQLISIIAKSRYLYGGQARLPLVLRFEHVLRQLDRCAALRPTLPNAHGRAGPEDHPAFERARHEGTAQIGGAR